MAEATTNIPLKIGIDFGGVLSIYHKNHRSDEDEHQSIEINMPNAIESLIKLKESGHLLYLISYCGERRAIETKRSILRTFPKNDLFNGLYFVQRTSDKADVCLSLGCDLMIDDKLKILNNIQSIIPTMKFIWFSSSEMNHPPDILKVESWCDLIKAIDEVLIYQAIRHKPDPRVLLNEKLHNI